ncbi:phosphinothricin acetyltransferase [Pilimelia anulata]|uniref:Phosphinothricin acetyltransferase n=1 Tax=Pilimelia anulata TaxID=53371 RepID=A0A8J3FCV9_9ACTN|nr:GNAT family N-acetyltransferase [Pilimelia anulata]GGK01859.1 phosphinothricin acetyltransferase [Pilimelia anulata]
MTTIRPAGPADLPHFHRLRTAVAPWQAGTEAGLRQRWARDDADPRAGAARFVAERDGAVLGTGRAHLNTMTSEPGQAHVQVIVDEPARRQQVGSVLLARLLEHLAGVGARRVTAWGPATLPTAGFAAGHGFRPVDESRISRLDLANPPPAEPLPPGVTVLPWSAVDPDELYSVDTATMADEPGTVSFDRVSRADWDADVWTRLDLDKDLSTATLVDGRCVAVALLDADRAGGRVLSAGTGTLREFRGQGYARLAKIEALRRAAAAGLRAAYAGNDAVNAPMLAVNTRLGYRPADIEWCYLRRLDS